MDAEYDYIIVGGGSAGCVLANRLTEDGARVLLLEAGPRDRHPLIAIPIGFGRIYGFGRFDWGYRTESETNLGGRQLAASRGKVLGGTSSINFMAYTRGHKGDYDRWARMGLSGWSYADVLPYFKRNETWEGGESFYRGGGGELGTQFAKTRDDVFSAWVDAGHDVGYPYTDDFNGAEQEGFGRSQYTIRDGRRSSSSRAFLRPALSRPNLTLETGAHVLKLLLRGTRAVGVAYRREGRTIEARADREVILSGGAYNSPQLLMLSGIGPAAHLREMGITPVADLPVGANLQDHLGAYLGFARKQQGAFQSVLRFDRMMSSLVRAYLFGTGPGTVVPGGLLAFIKTQSNLDVPDIEFMFSAVSDRPHLWFPFVKPPSPDGFGICPTLLHPESRGEILLRSADPFTPPRIRYNFFSRPNDLSKMRQGFKIAREIVSRKPLEKHLAFESKPGDAVRSDADIDEWLKRNSTITHHPCGTCAMGTVLDETLRVRGIEGLRVVDASAMPDLVSAHINACVLMMAEKASDMIRGRIPLPRAEV